MVSGTLLDAPEHEGVTLHRDPDAGYTGILAIHSTTLGPAVGGTRLWSYPGLAAAVADALRLSRGMSYKNALAGLPFGGGKAVILGPPPHDPAARTRLFRAHGRAIESLGGRFVTGEDVGTTPADMETIARETGHVAGRAGGMGDPSPFTARGVLRAMEAAAEKVWGDADLGGLRIALQGLGYVGTALAGLLHERGARLVVADVDPRRVARARSAWDAEVVAPDAILGVEAHILAPCALGGVLDAGTVDRLRVAVVCGAANNQLATEDADARLRARGIAYVPDYVANAGGVVSGAVDIAGWDRDRMERALDGIADTVRAVFAKSTGEAIPTGQAADRLAEERLRAGAPPSG